MTINAWFDDQDGVDITTWPRHVVDSTVALAITTASLADMLVGTAVSVTLTANRTGATTWSGTGLPPGTFVNPLTGVLSGTPSSPGDYTVQLRVTVDEDSATASLPLTVAAVSTYLVATPPLLVLSLAAGPVAITVRDASGNLLSAERAAAARAAASKPGYAQPARFFVGGTLTVTPVAVGEGTIEVVYGDQLDAEASVTIPVVVTP